MDISAFYPAEIMAIKKREVFSHKMPLYKQTTYLFIFSQWGPEAANVILLSSVYSSLQTCEVVRLEEGDWFKIIQQAFVAE